MEMNTECVSLAIVLKRIKQIIFDCFAFRSLPANENDWYPDWTESYLQHYHRRWINNWSTSNEFPSQRGNDGIEQDCIHIDGGGNDGP